jgi:hypothetical protein
LPFFKLLKKPDKFEWTAEADEAFQKLKEYLSTSLILTPPEKREPLLLYIAATIMIVSMTIVMERAKGHVYKVQQHVYYISEVLSESKAKHPLVQKLFYALLITSRKLHHYFNKHKVIMVSDFPFGMSYAIKMQQDAYPSGQLNSELRILSSPLVRLSNLKSWLIL